MVTKWQVRFLLKSDDFIIRLLLSPAPSLPRDGWPVCTFVGWDQRSAGPPRRKNGGPAHSLVPPYRLRKFLARASRATESLMPFHWLRVRRRVWCEPTERLAYVGPPLRRRTSVALPKSSHENQTLNVCCTDWPVVFPSSNGHSQRF